MPRELSGGMQQRASIVRALAQNPEVLLLDEPFGALDAFTRDEMNLLLLRLWQESGQTIVFVTHNISEAIFLADRVVVLTPRPGRLAHIYDIELAAPAHDRDDLRARLHRTRAGYEAHRGDGRAERSWRSNEQRPERVARRHPDLRRSAVVEGPRADRLDGPHIGAHGEERARDRDDRRSRPRDLLRAGSHPALDGHAVVRVPEADGRGGRALEPIRACLRSPPLGDDVRVPRRLRDRSRRSGSCSRR